MGLGGGAAWFAFHDLIQVSPANSHAFRLVRILNNNNPPPPPFHTHTLSGYARAFGIYCGNRCSWFGLAKLGGAGIGREEGAMCV